MQVAIIVHRKEIKLIPHMITTFDLVRAQRRLGEVRHMWTYDFCHRYIVDRLRREHCHPVPVAVWSDMWGTA